MYKYFLFMFSILLIQTNYGSESPKKQIRMLRKNHSVYFKKRTSVAQLPQTKSGNKKNVKKEKKNKNNKSKQRPKSQLLQKPLIQQFDYYDYYIEQKAKKQRHSGEDPKKTKEEIKNSLSKRARAIRKLNKHK